jgi:hypothetical protein
MSEEAMICDRLYRWQKEGQLARHTGAICPHRPDTLASFMHGSGWLTEDLRLALCRANPAYAWGQAQFDKTPNGVGPA